MIMFTRQGHSCTHIYVKRKTTYFKAKPPMFLLDLLILKLCYAICYINYMPITLKQKNIKDSQICRLTLSFVRG